MIGYTLCGLDVHTGYLSARSAEFVLLKPETTNGYHSDFQRVDCIGCRAGFVEVVLGKLQA